MLQYNLGTSPRKSVATMFSILRSSIFTIPSDDHITCLKATPHPLQRTKSEGTPLNLEFSDLPVDVARLIFEMAACSSTRTAHKLSFVSKAVREWTEPILYHSIVLDTAPKFVSFANAIKSKSRNQPDFFARWITSICIGNLSTGAYDIERHVFAAHYRQIFTACANTLTLALWAIDIDLADALRFLNTAGSGPKLVCKPTHISILNAPDWEWDAGVASVTHIDFEVYHDPSFPCQWTSLFAHYPSLAHLRVSGSGLTHTDKSVRVSPQALLEASRFLWVIFNVRIKSEEEEDVLRVDEGGLRVLEIAPVVVEGSSLEDGWRYGSTAEDSWEFEMT